jgi:hypothetical protein
MNASIPSPDENDPAGIGDILRRDARRIQEAPLDLALHREVMDRIRAMSETRPPRFQWGLAPTMALASAAAAIALIWLAFPPAHRRPATAAVEVPIRQDAPPIASVWSYEMGLAQGDAVFAQMLDRDAQTLLPASPAPPVL